MLDSSLLRMSSVGFVAPRDPMWASTLRAMDSELVTDSLVYRYDPSASPDGLQGSEGTFSLCTFRYVDALARAGRLDDARLAFEKMLTYANHLGLYSEEIALTGEQIGNFPQAFTHLASSTPRSPWTAHSAQRERRTRQASPVVPPLARPRAGRAGSGVGWVRPRPTPRSEQEVGQMTAQRIAPPGIAERTATGKDARGRTPPSSHRGWRPAEDRADPVALLEEQNTTREPDLVPVRHGRMMVSPFTFYRGAAKIMAADLKDTPTAGLVRPVVRRCASVELRRVRLAGA